MKRDLWAHCPLFERAGWATPPPCPRSLTSLSDPQVTVVLLRLLRLCKQS